MMKKHIRGGIALLSLALLPAGASVAVFAEPAEQAGRTVIMYCEGANLEEKYGSASHNFMQILDSDYNEDLNIIIMTGGAASWQLSGEYLSGAESIDPETVRLWKAEGKREGEEHGKMTLLTDEAAAELAAADMNDAVTLTALLDYCYDEYPAEKYDLIMWGHGSGPSYSYGSDPNEGGFFLADTVSALAESRIILGGNTFEFLDYDCCLMGNTEIVAALSDFSENIICSPEEESETGQFYTGWLNALKEDPELSGYEIGRIIVDDFEAYYKAGGSSAIMATLSVINTANFKTRLLPLLGRMDDALYAAASVVNGKTQKYGFYDEFFSRTVALEYANKCYDLIDLGGFLKLLGCVQHETAGLSGQELASRYNEYTDIVTAALEVLADDDNSGNDVIHTRNLFIPSRKADEHYLRGADGTYEKVGAKEDRVYDIGGLSLFFPSETADFTAEYIDAMLETADEFSGEIHDYLMKRIRTAAYYSLLRVAAKNVAEMVQYGIETVPDDMVEILDFGEQWEASVSPIVSEMLSSGIIDSTDELSELIVNASEQMAADMSSVHDYSVKQIRMADGEVMGYRIEAENVSPVISGIYTDCSVNPDEMGVYFNMYLHFSGYWLLTIEQCFPNGIYFFAEPSDAENDLTGFITDYYDGEEILTGREVASGGKVWDLFIPDAEYAALYDAEGTLQPGIIIYTNEEKTEGYIPIVTLEELRVRSEYYLYVTLSGETWHTVGLSSNIAPEGERCYVPMDSFAVTEGVPYVYSAAAYIYDHAAKIQVLLPTSSFSPVQPCLENWGITISAESPKEDFPANIYAKDVFGNKADLGEMIAVAKEAADAGDYLTYIGDADVTAQDVQAGEETEPELTITLGTAELVPGTDYRVLYDGSKEPGAAHLMIIGTGKYIGMKYAEYTILQPEEEPEEPDTEEEQQEDPDTEEEQEQTEETGTEEEQPQPEEPDEEALDTGDAHSAVLLALLMLAAGAVAVRKKNLINI